MSRRRLVSILIAMGLATGCSDGHQTEGSDGPLGPTPPSSHLCAIAGPAGVSTVGYVALTNSSRTPVHLKSVEMSDPKGLRILDASVVPIFGRTLIGTDPAFPPTYARVHAAAWQARKTIGEAVIPAGQTVNLVLGLRPESRPVGSMSELTLHYAVGKSRYVWHSGMTVTVAMHGERCRL